MCVCMCERETERERERERECVRERESTFPRALRIMVMGFIRISESIVCALMPERFRGGLVFKAHTLLYHSTLGLRVIKKRRSDV